MSEKFDLTVTTPGGRIAATTFLPDPSELTDHPVAVFALPGGGYSRGYFDIHTDGGGDYSQAEFHAARGRIFIALDHLGVGDSSTQGLDSMRIEDIADTNADAVGQIADMLRSGGLPVDYPPLPNVRLVGIGQSMGGGVTVLMQARRSSFDAIGVLGYSARHTVLPQRTEAERQKGITDRGRQSGRDADVQTLSLAESAASTEDYVYPFHWEDVDADLIAADMGNGYPIREVTPPWGSATLPNCVISMLSPGFIEDEANAITVPVFIGVGERDVVPDPRQEPSAYGAASDLTLALVPRMAHMHNFASTRRQLWDRIERWMTALDLEEARQPIR